MKRNSQEAVFSIVSPISIKTVETANCPAVQTTNTQAAPAAGDASPRIVPAIPPDLESTALGFFFHHYGRANTGRDIEGTCSFFGFLPAMYARESVSSPLSRAIAAFAVIVANLYTPRRSSATSVCQFYADAVAGTKRAVADPTRSKSDELLMTTLVLEAYEGIASSFQRRRQLHAHALGSIALLKHRGALNGRSELSRRMVIAVGGRFVRDAVGGLANIAAVHRLWEDSGVMRLQSPAIRADILALELAQLECLQRSLSAIPPPRGAQDSAAEADPYLSILSKASDLAGRCTRWRNTLSREWKSCPVFCYTLAPSIHAAGVYSSPMPSRPHCDVYRNLSVANTLNCHRITELRNLALIRTSLAAISADRSRHYSPLPFDLAETAQLLLDEICASVPFFAGDVTNFTDLYANYRIQLPHMAVPRSPWGPPGNLTEFLEDEAGYTQQVVTSGMWMIHGTLAAALELVAENQPLGTVPREGQVWWIRGQLSRLQAVFMISC